MDEINQHIEDIAYSCIESAAKLLQLVPDRQGVANELVALVLKRGE